MNLFQLVLKQMRQRALSTWLTLLSVLLGVALAVSILILRREAGSLFGQTDYGYDVLIGKQGSALQLVVNTVYHIDTSPGNIAYSVYDNLYRNPAFRADVRIAVPFAVGDSYKNLPIMGTLPKMFGYEDDGVTALAPEKVLEYRPGQKYAFADGRTFSADRFEAVIGSDVARLAGLKIGDEFQATHGFPRPNEKPDIHKPKWKVVGILKPTHTAADRVLHIPLLTFYTLAEHQAGLESQAVIRGDAQMPTTMPADDDDKDNYTLTPEGRIQLQLDKQYWALSGIMVKSRSPFQAMNLMYYIKNGKDATAVNPASVMRDFFQNFLKNSADLLLVIAVLVSVVAGVSILVSIYNSVSARMKEIAILRALGATKGRILSMICVEAGFIGLFGGFLGLLAGHLAAAGGSVATEQLLGQALDWLTVGREEWLYLGAVLVLSVLAGLVPAMKAYRTPVATNLVVS